MCHIFFERPEYRSDCVGRRRGKKILFAFCWGPDSMDQRGCRVGRAVDNAEDAGQPVWEGFFDREAGTDERRDGAGGQPGQYRASLGEAGTGLGSFVQRDLSAPYWEKWQFAPVISVTRSAGRDRTSSGQTPFSSRVSAPVDWMRVLSRSAATKSPCR